jgi:hypothetical protein
MIGLGAADRDSSPRAASKEKVRHVERDEL